MGAYRRRKMIQALYKLQSARCCKGRFSHKAVLKIDPEQRGVAWVDHEFNHSQLLQGLFEQDNMWLESSLALITCFNPTRTRAHPRETIERFAISPFPHREWPEPAELHWKSTVHDFRESRSNETAQAFVKDADAKSDLVAVTYHQYS